MYGIMTLSIMMMMNLLNGIMIIIDEKLKNQKQIKEILPIARHPDCVKDWCLSEDKKELWK